jgi:anthranilate 1,2-dioxygenase small subunit
MSTETATGNPAGHVPTISAERRSAIERMMVDYVHAINEGEYERWPTFFTEDGRYQVTGRDNLARGWVAGMLLCDNRDMMIDRIHSLRRVNVWEPHTYRHVIGPTQVLEAGMEGRSPADRFTVRAQTNYLCVRTMHNGEQKLFSAGRYLDDIVFEASPGGEIPRLRSRMVIADSNQIDTLLVIPL